MSALSHLVRGEPNRPSGNWYEIRFSIGREPLGSYWILRRLAGRRSSISETSSQNPSTIAAARPAPSSALTSDPIVVLFGIGPSPL
jgi:hypothetical protein